MKEAFSQFGKNVKKIIKKGIEAIEPHLEKYGKDREARAKEYELKSRLFSKELKRKVYDLLMKTPAEPDMKLKIAETFEKLPDTHPELIHKINRANELSELENPTQKDTEEMIKILEEIMDVVKEEVFFS